MNMIYDVGVLKKLREKQGLTQKELAERCGMKQFEYSRLENSIDMSVTKFIKIAKALGVNFLIL